MHIRQIKDGRSSLLRRSAAVLAAALLALGIMGAPAAASSGGASSGAADAVVLAGMSACPLTYFCVWNKANFSDGPGKWANAEWNYTNWSHDSCPHGSWNDCASSVYNHGQSCKVTFYENIDFEGAFFYQLPRGSYLANLALDKWSDGTSPDNKISSHNWTC